MYAYGVVLFKDDRSAGLLFYHKCSNGCVLGQTFELEVPFLSASSVAQLPLVPDSRTIWDGLLALAQIQVLAMKHLHNSRLACLSRSIAGPALLSRPL